MSNIEQPEQTETMDLATAQRVEQEKMTRRAALRKLGFGAGMAAFALLGVDDFARMVGKRMERMAGDNKVAEQVAKEFQGMGIAMAATPNPYYNTTCTQCEQHYQDCLSCKCNQPTYSGQTYDQCYNNQRAALDQCASTHCPGGQAPGPFPSPNPCGSVSVAYCA